MMIKKNNFIHIFTSCLYLFLFSLLFGQFSFAKNKDFFFTEKEGLRPFTLPENETKKKEVSKKVTSKTSLIDKEDTQVLDSKTTIENENKESSTNQIKESKDQMAKPSEKKLNANSSEKKLNAKPSEKKPNAKPSEKKPNANSSEDKEPDNRLSESFAPKEQEKISGIDFEDVSWVFQKKATKHKVLFIPVYSYNRTQSSKLGLRFFSYASDKKGYYFSFAASQYLFSPFSRWDLSYIGSRKNPIRIESSLIYDNHYENYFGKGMNNKASDLTKIYAKRFVANYKIFHQKPNQAFYKGIGFQIFFRKENLDHQNQKRYFDNEVFLYLNAFIGYDSRDNWRNPKKGEFHQLSFGCVPILSQRSSYCKGEGDIRFYFSAFQNIKSYKMLKNSVLALRAFAGSSFFAPSSYSLNYSLSGSSPFQHLKALRGFKHNRFLGDKIFFIQTELRIPLWKNFIGGVLFTELGEVSIYKESLKNLFVVDYGVGFRFGFPQTYDMKIRLDFGIGYDRQNERNYNVIVDFLHAF